MRKNRTRIIYVDDEPSLLDIGKIFLEKTGSFTVTIAESAQEAISILKDQPHEAIISDYQMPDMDGIAFLKHLRSAGDTTPFIIFTGKGREDIVIQALNEGADFYLQKGGDPKSQFAELSNKVLYAVRQRRAEIGVQEASERYKALIAVSNTGAWEYTLDSDYLWCSPEYFSMLGRYTGDYDLSGNSNLHDVWINLIHPDDRDQAAQKFRGFLEGNNFGIYENNFRMHHADGRWIWIWSRGWRLRDTNGELTGKTIGTHIDVTEQRKTEMELLQKNKELKAAEEEMRAANEQLTATEEEIRTQLDELAEQERKLRSKQKELSDIIEFLPDATFVINADKTVIAWNSAIEGLTGVIKDEILSRGDYAYSVPFYLEKRPILVDMVLGHIEDISSRYPYIQREGDRLISDLFIPHLNGGRGAYLWFTACPLYDDNNTIIGAIESIRDITGWKQAEMELHQKNEELAAAEEEIRSQLEEIITIRDQLEESNEYLGNLISHANAPIIVWDKHYKITRFNNAFGRLTGISPDQAIGKDLMILLPEETRDGSMDLIRLAMAGETWDVIEIPILHRSGEVRIVIWSSANIRGSDGKTITATIAQGQDITDRKLVEEALQTTNKKLQILSSITRHDIQNKIKALMGYLDLTRAEIDDSVISQYLIEMERAGNEIQQQIEFTRIYQGLGVRRPDWYVLEDLINTISDCTIPVHADCSGYKVLADPMIQKIFANLMDNTIRYAGKTSTVEIRCEERSGNLVICWEDNGPGIPDDQKEEIFKHESGKTKGLGLFLAREILAITGISITEEGTFGKGARFILRIPKGRFRREAAHSNSAYRRADE